MKILIATPYFLPKIGGVEKYTHSLALELQKQGNEVVIVTSGVKGGEMVRETLDGLTVYRLPFRLVVSNTPVSLRWPRLLRDIMAAEQPDIVNGHSPVPFMADVAAQAAKRLRVPFVLTYHSGSMLKGKPIPDAIIGTYEKHVLPRLLKASAAITTYNPFLATHYPRFADIISQAPPGVDTAIFTPAGRPAHDPHQLLYVGRMDRTSTWKGVHVLIDALALLVKDNPAYHLRLVGSGDAIEDYQAQADRLGIADHLTFVGERFGAELAAEYRDAGVFVLPSITESESFGIVQIEAMACGTPVVASDIGGMPEVIHRTGGGLLATPNNPADLAKTIARIAGDPGLRSRLATAGLDSVRTKYTWERTAAVYTEIFNAVRGGIKQIVHITPYYLPKLGGMERVAHELASSQATTPVTVITSTIGAGDAPRMETDGRYRVERLRALFVANTPLMPGLFFRLLRFPQESVFHMHVAQAFVPETALLAAKIKGIPFIAHFHLDTAPSGRFGFLLKPYKRFLFPSMLRAADSVVVFSGAQKELVAEKYGVDPQRIAIVPNGVGEQFFDSRERSLHDKPRLLFVGRLDAQKNVGFLLRALAGISDRFETHIVGDGQLRTQLETQARELGLHNVHFDGRADGDGLIDQYREADVFVLPSDREGMPLALLEAMAMGLPAVGSDVAGIHDLIKPGENGLLVPLDDDQALQDALQRITADQATYRHQSAMAQATAKAHSWPAVTALFADLYASVAASRAVAHAPLYARHANGAVTFEAKPVLHVPLVPVISTLLVICGALVIGGVPTLWTAPFILMLLPGYLLAKLLAHRATAIEHAAYTIGLSVLAAEIISLCNALWQPLLHINGFAPVALVASYAVITAALLTVLHSRRQDTQAIVLHHIHRALNRRSLLFAAACLTMPLLSYFGANRLNNGTDGRVVIGMVSLSLILAGWLFWHERRAKLPMGIPVFLYTASLAYLLMYAARSHFLIGWDIQQELGVASLTLHSHTWTINTLHDPYNAMLSITVLPAALSSLLHASLVSVFKFAVPIIFSIMPVSVYLLGRHLHATRLASLGAAVFFIGQYQFMQEMPALARQEIGFLFFGLLLTALTSLTLGKRARLALMLLFGSGLIVSHYATAYLAIGLLLVAYILPKFATGLLMRRTSTDKPLLPARISLGFVAFMFVFAFAWNGPVTRSSDNIQSFAHSIWRKVPDHMPSSLHIHWPQNRTVTGGNVTNPKARQDYARYVERKYHLRPGSVQADIQPAVSAAIPQRNATAYTAVGVIQRIVQWTVRLGGLAGCAILLITARRRRDIVFIEIAAMAASTIALVSIIQLIPGWSAQYNIERLAQQAMVIIAPVVCITLYTLLKRVSLRLVMPALYAFAGLTILLSSGLAAQIVGGTATLNLHAYGEDYDRFYITASEAASAQWLSDTYPGSGAVFADRYAARRLVNYQNLPQYAQNDVLPLTVTSSSYVYADHTNVAKGLEKNSAGQGIITYAFPADYLQGSKNIIYSGEGTIIYK